MIRLIKEIFKYRRSKVIKVFWSSNRYLANENWDNFGDALVPLLIEKISNRKIGWVPANKKVFYNHGTNKVFLTVGSILSHATRNNIVWGSGIIHSDQQLKKAKYLAVRGPISYSRVLSAGFKMKPIWGDPALLCPFYFPVPKMVNRNEITIVPHYVDYDEVRKKRNYDAYKILDLKDSDILKLITEIATSKLIFSSSLHGIIVAHAYGVKAIWVHFSDNLSGDDIKFYDYFLSVGIRLYKPYLFSEELLQENFPEDILIPNLEILNEVQLNLLHSCPFYNKR